MQHKFDTKFIEEFSRGLEKEVIRELDYVALRALTRLVSATPVDFGQARAGWNFTKNKIDKKEPSSNIIGTGATSGKEGFIFPPPDASPPLTAKRIGDSYNISNFVEHIIYLNEGHSEQRKDPKWIEREVALAARDVRNRK